MAWIPKGLSGSGLLLAAGLCLANPTWAQSDEPEAVIDTASYVESESEEPSEAYTEDEYTEEESDYSRPNAERLQQHQQDQAGYRQEPVATRPFDEKRWQEATEGLDYSDPDPKPEVQEMQMPSGGGGIGVGAIAQVVLMVLVVVVIAALIYYLLGGSFGGLGRKVGGSGIVSLEDLEENLPQSDLERALAEALRLGNYRLAVRIHYLMVIKDLTERGWITWKRDKTNRQYLNEMRERPDFAGFRGLTLEFENVWYGQAPVTETSYPALAGRFRHYLDSLRTSVAA